MPRANRYFLPGYVWHITHRCHQKGFLLKFKRDRERWLYWLFQAKKRYGLCVLNYIVTSNHIHLLVKSMDKESVSKSMQLIAGRTAQEYNQRKSRRGAYWEDRYHATIIGNDEYLFKCLVYIDLNMVRAGVVAHPCEWKHSGYNEIQSPPDRYRLINMESLVELSGFNNFSSFRQSHKAWIETELAVDHALRIASWSDGVAMGSDAFIEHIQVELGNTVRHRNKQETPDGYVLKESGAAYNTLFGGKNSALSMKRVVYLDEY